MHASRAIIASGMAAAAPVLYFAFCAEKKALGDAYYEALQDLIGLQIQELEAIKRSRPPLDRYALAMKRARRKVDSTKEQYIFHVRAHGC